MKSNIADAIALRYPPLAIFFAQKPPEGGREAKGTCSMIPVSQAAKGEIVYFQAGSCGCPGAASGFGLETLAPDRFSGGRISSINVKSDKMTMGRKFAPLKSPPCKNRP